jgi:hypothetical protein
MSNAEQVLAEIIDHFADGDENPGDHWCPDEHRTSYGLDYKGKDGRKFWLDLDKDGTITVFWKRPSGDHSVVVFRQVP